MNTMKPRNTKRSMVESYHMADFRSEWDHSNGALAKSSAQPRWKGLLRHLLRFWYAYFLLIAVCVLAIILPIVYVLYPRTAQSQVDSSTIIPTHQSITKVTPTSFFYNQSALLEISSSYNPPPQLFSWNGSYYNEGASTPFLEITIPQIAAKNGSEIHPAQEIQITNMDEFITNNKLIFGADSFSIYLRGHGTLKESILPTIDITYDKKITLRGFNNLPDISVTEFHVLGSKLADGANAAGNVSIANPSIFELHMGNVTLNISVNGTRIGNATMPNFNLRPGTNEYPLHVTANETQVLELLKLPAYRCGILPVTIQGQESTVDGQVIPYFSAPLQAYQLSTMMNVTNTLAEIGLASLVNGTCET